MCSRRGGSACRTSCVWNSNMLYAQQSRPVSRVHGVSEGSLLTGQPGAAQARCSSSYDVIIYLAYDERDMISLSYCALA